MATAKIRSANAASMSTLAPDLPRSHTANSDGERSRYVLSLLAASSLPPMIKDRIYALFHANMSPLSRGSSLGYTEASKREELFESTGRILLLSRSPASASTSLGLAGSGGVEMPGAMPPSPSTLPPAEDIVGYVSFRFDTEETLGSRDAEVIYCYELQLDPRVRRQGLGQVLMLEMEDIGRRRGMDKAMLTCLMCNTGALGFYRKQGYEPDEIDPTRMAQEPDSDEDEDGVWEQVGPGSDEGEEEGVDYVILSKPLR